MAARSIWKGSVGFGLVNVPCKLYSATEENGIHFNQLHKGCNARINLVKKCSACGEEVSEKLGNLVKGYEVSKGQYVLMEEADFQKVPAITGQNVSVLAFVDVGKIDPRHTDKSYFLAPDDKLGGAKAFSLLLQAMEKVGKVGIVKLIYREKEHLAVIRPFGRVLLLQTMFYTDELRPASEVETSLSQVSDKELAMGVMLLQTLEVGDIDLSQYKDGYQEALKTIIQAKLEGKTIEVKAEEPKPATDDLVAALMASLKDKQPAGAGA